MPMLPAPSLRRAAQRLGACALGAAALACGAGDTATAPTASAPLAVQLTDAPFPFGSVARADVYIARIDARTVAADSADAATGANDPDSLGATHGGWITIATPRQRYNLLDLQNGKTANLGQLSLPLGTYQAFRLIMNVDSSSVTLTDGTQLTGSSTPGIRFPSAGRTGIKVNLAAPVTVGGTGSTIVLDFDLAHSFVLRGNDILRNGLLFKPVIRAVARDVSGSITGTVHADSASGAPVANALVEVLVPTATVSDTASADVVASTKADSTGAYHVAFIRPGSYQVRATPPAGSGYDAALLAGGVTVTQSADASTKPIVLAKSATLP